MKICVVGLGYIGLPTSLMFAKAGHEVVGVDVNPKVVEALKQGNLHIEENGLQEILTEVNVHYSFQVQTTPPDSADVYIIAVPTPIKEDRTADLNYVISAAQNIVPQLKKGDVVIVESTIPPRTTVDIIAPIIAESGLIPGVDVFLSHCPERVLPGRIFVELVENNRIIGGINEKSAHRAAEVYRSFVKGEIIISSATSAEMAKLMENTYRDVNIALANELAKLSAAIGIDALEVISLANKHPRVHLHSPGPGVGGHCIAVDPYFIIEKDPQLTPLISASREINNSMPHFVVEQVKQMVRAQAAGKIAVFGITYKGNVDDIRESPALEIVELLNSSGYEVAVHDPHVIPSNAPFKLYSAGEALEDADCLLVLADHNEFKVLDEEALLAAMKHPRIFDTKHCVTVQHADKIELFHYGNLYKLQEKRDHVILNDEVAAGKSLD